MSLMFIQAANIIPLTRSDRTAIFQVPTLNSTSPFVPAPSNGNPALTTALMPQPIITPQVDSVAVFASPDIIQTATPPTSGGGGVMEFVKANPVPIAIGAGILIYALTRKKRRK